MISDQVVKKINLVVEMELGWPAGSILNIQVGKFCNEFLLNISLEHDGYLGFRTATFDVKDLALSEDFMPYLHASIIDSRLSLIQSA